MHTYFLLEHVVPCGVISIYPPSYMLYLTYLRLRPSQAQTRLSILVQSGSGILVVLCRDAMSLNFGESNTTSIVVSPRTFGL